MVKKTVLVVLLVCMSAFVCPLFALDTSAHEPYSEMEFPKWALDLRRGECIFFGSVPITFALSSLVFNTFSSTPEFWKTMALSCSVSAVIAVIDYILGIGK